MSKKFTKRSLYTAATNGDNIPKSEFAGGQTVFNFYSKKNTEKNPLTGEITNKLSYKIGKAVSLSQDTKCQIFLAEKEGIPCVVGFFEGGSVGSQNSDTNGLDIFAIDVAMKGIVAYATNVHSHFLPQMILAMNRYEEAKDEIDLFFRQLNFNTPEGVIGIDQKQAFLIVTDSLRIETSKLDGISFIDNFTLNEMGTFKYLYNITPFLLNEGAGEWPTGLIWGNGERFNDLDLVPAKYPTELDVEDLPKTKNNRLAVLKKMYYDGAPIYTPEEIKAMPLILQNGYEMAQSSFFANREFFGIQEWELIDAIACGDVHSINFTGPAGVGKTTTIRSIAGALGMPFVLVGGSANIEESDLLGTRGVEAKDGVSVTTWTDGPITTAIRYGAFLLFDEVNSAEPGILMKLNTILDGSKSLILSTAEEVKVHPNFVYSEAMNVGAGYVGTDVLNQSHLDRCDEVFKISAKQPKDEAKIIASVTGYDNLKNIEKLCEIKRYICRLIEEDGDPSEQSCSPRRIIAWVKKARRTGEFVESSLSTVISHISIYDDSFSTLDVDEVLNSSGIAASAMQVIQERLRDVQY